MWEWKDSVSHCGSAETCLTRKDHLKNKIYTLALKLKSDNTYGKL